MKIACLFSGGKDSCYSLWYMLHQGFDVVALISVKPDNPASWMFHYPAIEWTKLQAESMEIPMILLKTSGKKDEELNDLKELLNDLKENLGIKAISFGAIASDYQKTRIERLCEELGLKSFAPLWHKNPESLLLEEINFKFEIIITACSALGFTKDWIGKKIDKALVEKLKKLSKKYGIHIGFEGGEAETFVLDSPIFKKRIQIIDSEIIWKGDSGYLMIKDARLCEKH
jgi:ABC transporter with metal-binding/Fe-S-binding domain ATP-binding protein